MQNNAEASNPTIIQLNNPANRPEGIQQAAQLLRDAQEDLIDDKTYTAENIWAAYTDAQKIRSTEKQTDFLKRVLQSQIDMKAFCYTEFPNFQDLIKGFAETIQQDLYRLIVKTDQCSFQLRTLALRQMKLSSEEKEAYLSSIRKQLLEPEVLQFINHLEDLSLYLQDFPKATQNEVFKHIVDNAYFTKIGLDALHRLLIPLEDLKTICFDFWSKNCRTPIQHFPKSIQQDLCRSIIDSRFSWEFRISALSQSDLPSDEKETYLSAILQEVLTVNHFGREYELEDFQSSLKSFPKSIQNNLYIKIAKSDCPYKMRLWALNLLDISLDENRELYYPIFWEVFRKAMSGYFQSSDLLSFLESCSKDLKLELYAQTAKDKSLLSPFRMKIVELMEAGPVKDEALSVMLVSNFFKLQDKIKLAKLINDSSQSLKILGDLLVKAPYAHFEYMDKYEEKGEALKKAFDCEDSLSLRLQTCFAAGDTSPVGDLKYRILEQFFKSCTVDRVRLIKFFGDLFIEFNQDEKDLIISHFPEDKRSDILKCCFKTYNVTMNHFFGILDAFFETGSEEERQLIVVNFPKYIDLRGYQNFFDTEDQSFSDLWLLSLFDRFERFYQARDSDQETKKTFVMNLLFKTEYLDMLSDYPDGKDNIPINLKAYSQFCEHVWNLYVGEFPEECKAPEGGILQAIALNATIPVNSRQDILRSCATDKRLLEELLLLTEPVHTSSYHGSTV